MPRQPAPHPPTCPAGADAVGLPDRGQVLGGYPAFDPAPLGHRRPPAVPLGEVRVGGAQVRDERYRGVELVEPAAQPGGGEGLVVAVAAGHPLGHDRVRVRMQPLTEQRQHLIFADLTRHPEISAPRAGPAPGRVPRGLVVVDERIPRRPRRVPAGHLPGQVGVSVAGVQHMARHRHRTITARARCSSSPQTTHTTCEHVFVCVRTSRCQRCDRPETRATRARGGGRVRDRARRRRGERRRDGAAGRGVAPEGCPPGLRAVLALRGGECGDRRGQRGGGGDRGRGLRALRVAPVGHPLRDDRPVRFGGDAVVGA